MIKCEFCGFIYNRKVWSYICPMCEYPSPTCCDGQPCQVKKEETSVNENPKFS